MIEGVKIIDILSNHFQFREQISFHSHPILFHPIERSLGEQFFIRHFQKSAWISKAEVVHQNIENLQREKDIYEKLTWDNESKQVVSCDILSKPRELLLRPPNNERPATFHICDEIVSSYSNNIVHKKFKNIKTRTLYSKQLKNKLNLTLKLK